MMSENKMFKPFENGHESHAIHDLTLENQQDYVSLYGNLQITKDKSGLETARVLQAFLGDIVAVLENDAHLPEKIRIQAEHEIENPFL